MNTDLNVSPTLTAAAAAAASDAPFSSTTTTAPVVGDVSTTSLLTDTMPSETSLLLDPLVEDVIHSSIVDDDTPLESLAAAVEPPPPVVLETPSPTTTTTSINKNPPPPPPQLRSTKPPAPVTSAPIATTTKTTASTSTTTKSSKKKKGPVTAMGSSSSASSAPQAAAPPQGENTGRWTADEHRLFLQGLEAHGKGWKKIASLIKSRTVVQIRTHAQKYFQKLAKARQNGEEGDVSMEGRGGLAGGGTGIGVGGIGGAMGGIGMGPHGTPSMSTSTHVPTGKRRRQTGTKRKAIASVVASATSKKSAVNIPAVAPALTPFVVPTPPPPPVLPATTNNNTTTVTTVATSHGSISGPALEDSLFRFLTPAPVLHSEPPQAQQPSVVQVNEIARQAGANPITLPLDNPSTVPSSSSSGDVSPTGVTDVAIFPSWTDAKGNNNDMPSWYAKGADVDCLLDVADTLDWLNDSGDLHETYEAPAAPIATTTTCSSSTTISMPTTTCIAPVVDPTASDISGVKLTADPLAPMTVGGESSSSSTVPPLPSLFDTTTNSTSTTSLNDGGPVCKKQKLITGTESMEDHLDVFDTPIEEHVFVSALLEGNGIMESSGSLPVLP